MVSRADIATAVAHILNRSTWRLITSLRNPLEGLTILKICNCSVVIVTVSKGIVDRNIWSQSSPRGRNNRTLFSDCLIPSWCVGRTTGSWQHHDHSDRANGVGELTAEDLEKIRQIVTASETALTSRIEKVNSNVEVIDTRLRSVETGVAELRGRNIGVSAAQSWGVALCALGALIVSIIALVKAEPKAIQTTRDPQKQQWNSRDPSTLTSTKPSLITPCSRHSSRC